jgi:hypothetical protein
MKMCNWFALILFEFGYHLFKILIVHFCMCVFFLGRMKCVWENRVCCLQAPMYMHGVMCPFFKISFVVHISMLLPDIYICISSLAYSDIYMLPKVRSLHNLLHQFVGALEWNILLDVPSLEFNYRELLIVVIYNCGCGRHSYQDSILIRKLCKFITH